MLHTQSSLDCPGRLHSPVLSWLMFSEQCLQSLAVHRSEAAQGLMCHLCHHGGVKLYSLASLGSIHSHRCYHCCA